MKTIALCLLSLLLVWLFFARPDRASEIAKIEQRLSSEADVRSQALTNLMQKYRLATVLFARRGIIEDILQGGTSLEAAYEEIEKLEALSGIKSISVMLRDNPTIYPTRELPSALATSEQWQTGITTAFQGSLGRAFFFDDKNHPVYAFFAPHYANGAPPAIVIVMINMVPIEDSWISQNTVTLWSSSNELMLTNDGPDTKNAITIKRPLTQLNASLHVSAPPIGIFGTWLMRSLMFGLLLLLGGVLLARQLERRRFLTQLAAQRASEASRLELEVEQRTRELKEVQSQLIMTEKLTLLGQMSASISHEINQPLAALKNYTVAASRLLEKGQPKDAQNNLGLISGLTDRISRIVVNLRSFATDESVPVQAIDIVPVVQTAIEELTDRYPIAKQYCRLVSHDSNNSPLLAMAGHVRLLQVLSNLLINAWLACKDSDPPTIEVSLQQSIDKVTISVTDNGPGIHNKDADNMFTAFVTTRDAQSGLGLGLTISRSFVENMGGTINLDTAVTTGAKFIVTLRKPKS